MTFRSHFIILQANFDFKVDIPKIKSIFSNRNEQREVINHIGFFYSRTLFFELWDEQLSFRVVDRVFFSIHTIHVSLFIAHLNLELILTERLFVVYIVDYIHFNFSFSIPDFYNNYLGLSIPYQFLNLQLFICEVIPCNSTELYSHYELNIALIVLLQLVFSFDRNSKVNKKHLWGIIYRYIDKKTMYYL